MKKPIASLVALALTLPAAAPASAAPNDHYASLLSSPNLYATASWRSQDEINVRTIANFGETTITPNSEVTYDADMDAAKVTIKPADADIGQQLGLRFPLVMKGDGTRELSFQWDARWSGSYLSCSDDGLTGQKFVWLNCSDCPVKASANRRIEFTSSYSGNSGQDWVVTPQIRTYGMDNEGEGDGTQQPGGALEVFRIDPDVWVRFTASVTYTDENGDGQPEQRLRMWLADENRDPVLVMADPANPNIGFLIDGTAEGVVGLSSWNLTMDSSQDRPEGTTPLDMWIRNTVVFKDATVPLGGRPTGRVLTTPVAHSFYPFDDQTEVDLNDKLYVTFSEPVFPRGGADNDIVIRRSDGSIVESIDVQSAQVTGGGTTAIVADPANPLPASTDMYVQIGAGAFQDASGNPFAGLSSSTRWNFRTRDPDFDPPVINSITVTDVTATSARINWMISEEGMRQVEYGTTPGLGTLSPETSRSRYNITKLTADTLYYFRVIAKDTFGNVTVSDTRTFRTLVPVDDTAPPVISDIAVTNVTGSSARVTWKTNEPARSRVDYGTTADYEFDAGRDSLVSNHSVDLEGLEPDTVYHFSVTSVDAAGNPASSPDAQFETGLEAANLRPTARAGDDQTITLPATVELKGSAADDGKPAGSVLSVAWSKVSGPGDVAFDDASSAATAARISAPGEYVLRLTASDGALSASDEVVVTVQPSLAGATEPAFGRFKNFFNAASGENLDVTFDLPAGGHVRLLVVDRRQARVRTIADGAFGPGQHTVAWDGRNDDGTKVAPGVYGLIFEAGGKREKQKIAVLR